MFSLPENCKIVEALKPATDAAGRTGQYVSLKNAKKLWIVVNIDQGNAATIALTLSQAKTVAGGSAKPTTKVQPIWANEDCSTSDTLVRQTDAISFTTSAAVKRKVVVFEIDPATLDLVNAFDCLAIITGASNVANLTEAIYYLLERYAQATPPSAIVD